MANFEQLVRERLDAGGFTSQRDAINFAADLACAEAMPKPEEFPNCSRALCIGLFGPAWGAANEDQRDIWVEMAVEAYCSKQAAVPEAK